ncbi:hypothetical protein LCGC14_2706850 [marine sediment metagenome]|uniref:Uncharacterized protein n=1 Tax=marine sediment metagenome TaxID=412755 RepID=A0A0F8ZE76_9ZZZZ
MNKKLKELTRLWCKWNRKEITGDTFAIEVEKLYHKEVIDTWNDPLEKLLYN